MKMKPEHADRWRELLCSRDLTLRSQLIVAKRCARHLGAVLEWEMRGNSVEQVASEKSAKFTSVSLRNVQKKGKRSARFSTVRRQTVPALKQALAEIGKWLYANDVQLTELNGIEGVCDLLEVNPVHRGEVSANASCEDRAIQAVAFDCGNESSAASLSGKRPAECKEGPLFSALYELAKRGGVVEA